MEPKKEKDLTWNEKGIRQHDRYADLGGDPPPEELKGVLFWKKRGVKCRSADHALPDAARGGRD